MQSSAPENSSEAEFQPATQHVTLPCTSLVQWPIPPTLPVSISLAPQGPGLVSTVGAITSTSPTLAQVPITVSTPQVGAPVAVSAQDLVNQIMASVTVQLQQQAKASKMALVTPKPRIKWRREGHRIQFEFNESLETRLELVTEELKSVSPDLGFVLSAVLAVKDDIAYRQKLIRVADSTKNGWKAVEFYEGQYYCIPLRLFLFLFYFSYHFSIPVSVAAF
jgi:hypothetical protein